MLDDQDKETIRQLVREEILAYVAAAKARKKERKPKADAIEFTDFYRWRNIMPEHIALWKEAYPALNLDIELAKAAAWIRANPENRKSNWERYLNNWFKKEQDKAARSTKALMFPEQMRQRFQCDYSNGTRCNEEGRYKVGHNRYSCLGHFHIMNVATTAVEQGQHG